MRAVAACLMAGVAAAACGGSMTPATPAQAPEGWEYRRWSDPDFEIALPTSFDCAPRGGTDLSDPYVLTTCQGGVPTPLGASDPALVTVLRGDPGESLEAWLDQLQPGAVRDFQVRRRPVQLPAGPAIQTDYSGQGPRVGSQTTARGYAFTLPDGRYMLVQFTAIADGSSFPNEHVRRFADDAIRTLRPSP